MSKTDDQMIVERVLAGEKNAFAGLVEQYKGMVYGLALSKLRDEEEAKDITQDVFLEAYLSLDTLREASKFSSWLYGIAANLCRMWVRRERMRDETRWLEEIPEMAGVVFDESYPSVKKMPASQEKFQEDLRRYAEKRGVGMGEARRKAAPTAISPEEVKGFIFMPDESSKWTQEVEPIENGRGLGLYFAGQIAWKHGGRIWVEDYAPEGALFTVELSV